MNARKHVWIGSIGLLCVLCAGAVLVAGQQTAPPESAPPAAPPANTSPDGQDPRYRLNVNVELVNVTATVRDEQGKYMDGLKT